MSNQSIYNILRTGGMTKEGACAMLGNMAAESAMRANNAQDIYGVVDEDYTFATDNGQNNFVNDSIGYGLCQWTLASRKQKLLSYAKSQGVSVGDESMQVNFCLKELKEDFPDIWKTLTTSHDLLTCTQVILNVYENPAVKNLGTRLNYAQKAAEYFDNAKPPDESNDEIKPTQNTGVKAAIMVLQLVMSYAGYWGEVTGEKSNEFFNALHTFVEALEKT